MKQSQLFGKTLKETPADMTVESHKLLYRAGFIRESVAGRYYFLPLGWRVHEKIRQIVKEEMDAIGCQEVLAPTLHPLELWKETNRTNTAGFELMKVKDRRDAEFALGGTAEEMFCDLVRKFTVSYKDLPFTLYQFSNKFRDELRARGGLLRVREFVMKDAYSFHSDEEDFKKTYNEQWQAYLRIFKRFGLNAIAVSSDNGYIGGEYCHEFVVETKVGESRVLMTEDGSYAAHEDVAIFEADAKNLEEEIKEMTEVDAVREANMEAGVACHNLPLWQQMKDVMMVDEDGRYILAVIRGDLDVNEIKLTHIVGARELRMATEAEVRELGTEPGFISPVGIDRTKVTVVGDKSLRTVRNMYTGANKKHRDLLNVNIDRDYTCDIEDDIAMVQAGFKTVDGKVLREMTGVEVGNIFQLGYHYSNLMDGLEYMDEKGQRQKYYMGCYGIGIGRNLATIAELYHDDKGLVWPESVAPFQVHLISLNEDEKAEELYNKLTKKGVEVLYDDRNSRAGEKFADSDLIGIPNRVVISKRSLENGGYEFKNRNERDSRIVSEEELMGMF